MFPDRLKTLEANIAELHMIMEKYSIEDIKDDLTKQWALRYGLLESIQIMIDICCHITAHHNFGNTDTYRECIEALEKFKVIDETFTQKAKSMVGLRNILVHDYVKIDMERLYEYLNHLDDFEYFVTAVRPFLNKQAD